MLVRAVVGWGGRGVRGDTDRIARADPRAGSSRTSWPASTRWRSCRRTGRSRPPAGAASSARTAGSRPPTIGRSTARSAACGSCAAERAGTRRPGARSTTTSADPAAIDSRCSAGSTRPGRSQCPDCGGPVAGPSPRRRSTSRAAAGPRIGSPCVRTAQEEGDVRRQGRVDPRRAPPAAKRRAAPSERVRPTGRRHEPPSRRLDHARRGRRDPRRRERPPPARDARDAGRASGRLQTLKLGGRRYVRRVEIRALLRPRRRVAAEALQPGLFEEL